MLCKSQRAQPMHDPGRVVLQFNIMYGGGPVLFVGDLCSPEHTSMSALIRQAEESVCLQEGRPAARQQALGAGAAGAQPCVADRNNRLQAG